MGRSSLHPWISSQLPVGQNFEISGINGSERKARAEEHLIHSDEGYTGEHIPTKALKEVR